jgi:hypothetical protein
MIPGMGRKAQARRTRASRVRVVRGRRIRDEGWHIASVHESAMPVGPDIVLPDMADVVRAIERAPRGDDWSSVSKLVIPVFPRVRPLPDGSPESLRVLLPPGVLVGFAVDIGPAFLNVSREQLTILGVAEADLVGQALANLLARAQQVEPASVVHETLQGLPLVGLQTGLSVGSTLVLVPDQLARLFGPTPRLFMAPMRDVLLGLPDDADPELVAWLFDDFASQDPNALPPIGFRFDGARVATASLGPLAAAVATARQRLA